MQKMSRSHGRAIEGLGQAWLARLRALRDTLSPCSASMNGAASLFASDEVRMRGLYVAETDMMRE